MTLRPAMKRNGPGYYEWCGYRVEGERDDWKVYAPNGRRIKGQFGNLTFGRKETAVLAVGRHAESWMKHGSAKVAKLKAENDELRAEIERLKEGMTSAMDRIQDTLSPDNGDKHQEAS